MYNETVIEFCFCDIQNNQGLGKAKADYTCLSLDYYGYHKNLNPIVCYLLNSWTIDKLGEWCQKEWWSHEQYEPNV